jgi:predicted nucleotidyltransferase
MRYGLREETIQNITAIFETFPQVEKVVLYGSRAKGNYKPASDIDLTVFGQQMNLTLLQKLETSLDDLMLPYTIDLSIFHQISNPDLTAHINRVGQVLFEREAD